MVRDATSPLQERRRRATTAFGNTVFPSHRKQILSRRCVCRIRFQSKAQRFVGGRRCYCCCCCCIPSTLPESPTVDGVRCSNRGGTSTSAAHRLWLIMRR